MASRAQPEGRTWESTKQAMDNALKRVRAHYALYKLSGYSVPTIREPPLLRVDWYFRNVNTNLIVRLCSRTRGLPNRRDLRVASRWQNGTRQINYTMNPRGACLGL